jgi:hypothetical protein
MIIPGFIRDFFKQRSALAPHAMYKYEPFVSNDNRSQVYETLMGAPPMELAGVTGVIVAQSGAPGSGSFGMIAWDAQVPLGVLYGNEMENAGENLVEEITPDGALYWSADSSPAQELV